MTASSDRLRSRPQIGVLAVLAEMVGQSGWMVGVDFSEPPLSHTQARWPTKQRTR
jgi:hypothetical protein